MDSPEDAVYWQRAGAYFHSEIERLTDPMDKIFLQRTAAGAYRLARSYTRTENV